MKGHGAVGHARKMYAHGEPFESPLIGVDGAALRRTVNRIFWFENLTIFFS